MFYFSKKCVCILFFTLIPVFPSAPIYAMFKVPKGGPISDPSSDATPHGRLCPGKISLKLEDALPDTWTPEKKTLALELLNGTKLESMKDPSGGKWGFSYPCKTSWNIFALKLITKELRQNPNLVVGDLASGNGTFSMAVVAIGAFPFAVEMNREQAENARSKVIPLAKPFCTKSLVQSYRIACGDIANPPQAYIGVMKNVVMLSNALHYMKPREVHKCLDGLYDNLEQNGYAVVVVETPYAATGPHTDFYHKNTQAGVEFPGYAVYTQSRVSSLSEHIKVPRNAVIPTPEEEEMYLMGKCNLGFFRPSSISPYDDGSEVIVEANAHPQDPTHILSAAILNNRDDLNPKDFPELLKLYGTGNFRIQSAACRDPLLEQARTKGYTYSTTHTLFNPMDFPELRILLEKHGFTVLEGYYGDVSSSALLDIKEYARDPRTLGTLIRSRIMVLAQKRCD